MTLAASPSAPTPRTRANRNMLIAVKLAKPRRSASPIMRAVASHGHGLLNLHGMLQEVRFRSPFEPTYPHPADAAAAGAVPLRRRSTAPPLLHRPAGPPDSRSAFGRTYPCRIDAVAAFPRRRAAAPPRRRTAAAAPSPSRRAAPSPSRRAKSLSRRGAAARCTYRLAGSSRRQQQLRAVMPPRRRAAVPSFTTLPPPLLSLPALAATRPPQLGGSRRIGHRQ